MMIAPEDAGTDEVLERARTFVDENPNSAEIIFELIALVGAWQGLAMRLIPLRATGGLPSGD